MSLEQLEKAVRIAKEGVVRQHVKDLVAKAAKSEAAKAKKGINSRGV